MSCYFEKQSIQHAFIEFGSYLAGPLGLEIRYWPDRTYRNMGICQTEQTKIAIGQTEGATQIFSRPLWTVAPDPPVRDPSRSGQYLSWVADFILGNVVVEMYDMELVYL